MVEEKGTAIGGLMSPQRGKKKMEDVMKGVELPLLEGSMFDGNTPSIEEIRDDGFPPDLVFSPLRGLCSNDFPGYSDLLPPAQVSSPKKTKVIKQQSVSQKLISLPEELFSMTKKSKPKTKRTRKRRRGGNCSSRAKRKKSKNAPTAPILRDPSPRMCTAPLCGTMHGSLDKLRSHIQLCHPNMRMRCWFPGCKQTFMIPEDLEEHAMDEHMPKRESSFFSRTKIRFKELTEVPADGEIRPTKDRKQRAPRIPTAVEAYSGTGKISQGEKEKSEEPSLQLIPLPVQSPSSTSRVIPPIKPTPVPSPLRLKDCLPFTWMTDSTVENTTPSNLEKGIEEFFCLDPNPRMPLWNRRVTEMHMYWVNDRKRAGYTPEIELTDSYVEKEDRGKLQANITSFITAHLADLSAVMHVDDQNWSGRESLSFTMDTPKRTVLARVTGMEYSNQEWNKKVSAADSRRRKGFYELNNGKAIIDGYSCWGNRCTRLVEKAEEEKTETGDQSIRGNLQTVNVTFRGIPMAFFVTARDVHAGELAYLLSRSSSKP